MRLYGIDRRYFSDHLYIIFLYQVKEALEIKISRVTYFRKSKMNKIQYTKATIMNVQKTEIERADLDFKVFRTIIGTITYFQAK